MRLELLIALLTVALLAIVTSPLVIIAAHVEPPIERSLVCSFDSP